MNKRFYQITVTLLHHSVFGVKPEKMPGLCLYQVQNGGIGEEEQRTLAEIYTRCLDILATHHLAHIEIHVQFLCSLHCLLVGIGYHS